MRQYVSGWRHQSFFFTPDEDFFFDLAFSAFGFSTGAADFFSVFTGADFWEDVFTAVLSFGFAAFSSFFAVSLDAGLAFGALSFTGFFSSAPFFLAGSVFEVLFFADDSFVVSFVSFLAFAVSFSGLAGASSATRSLITRVLRILNPDAAAFSWRILRLRFPRPADNRIAWVFTSSVSRSFSVNTSTSKNPLGCIPRTAIGLPKP